MRNLGIMLSLVTMVMFLFACGGGGAPANDPSSVAQVFLERLAKLDFDGAKELATKDGQKVLSMMQGFMAMADEEDKKKMSEESGAGAVTIVSVDEQGDKATVIYSMGDKKEEPLELVKENGQWKVNFQKELS